MVNGVAQPLGAEDLGEHVGDHGGAQGRGGLFDTLDLLVGLRALVAGNAPACPFENGAKLSAIAPHRAHRVHQLLARLRLSRERSGSTSGCHDVIVAPAMRYLACLVVLLISSANLWAAEPPGDEAKARVRKATGEYNLGQYIEAARDYEAAYLETLDANLLFNVGQAYRLAGETDKAITAYRSYLRSNPPSDRRALAESKLREVEEKRASAPVPPRMPTTPAVAPVPAAPLSPPAPVASSATPEESPRAPAAPPGSEPNALVTQPVSEPSKSGAFYTRWPFWALTGVVVAGGVVAAVLLATRGESKLDMGNPTMGTKEY
jgi:hypothetical protein